MGYTYANVGGVSMKIQEVMKLTRISKKALQYYEDKHLIHVKKDTNGYRDYDEVCVNQLWQIKVLRKMDLSILEIEQILKDEQRDKIFKEHFNEIDQRLSQCIIQKDYLERLYNDVEFASDPKHLQQLDCEMEEDFKRNEEIVVEFKKHRSYAVHVVFIIVLLLIGIGSLLEKTNEKTIIVGIVFICGALYKAVELLSKKEQSLEITPLSIMLEDGVTKMSSFIERRKKL